MQSNMTPYTPQTKLSSRAARRAEHLRASLPARQAAAVSAANQEREAWLEWRRAIKARRDARAAARPTAEPASLELSAQSLARLEAKDRKSGKLLTARERTRKERRMAKLEAILGPHADRKTNSDTTALREKEKDAPSAPAAAGPMLEHGSSSSTPTSQADTTTVVPAQPSSPSPQETLSASTLLAKPSSAQPSAPHAPAAAVFNLATPPASPSLAPQPTLVASTSKLTYSPVARSTPPMTYLDLTQSDDESDWSDEGFSDDEDPQWQDLDDPEDGEADYYETEQERSSDKWNFSLPALFEMASAVSEHVAHKEASRAWGIVRLVGGPGVLVL